MRNYETIYILNTSLDAEQTAALIAKFNQVITDNGGELVKVDEWGKRRLAYEVNKNRDGYYVLTHFNAEPAVAHELERVFKINDGVIRYLVVRLEEVKAKAKAKAEVKAEAEAPVEAAEPAAEVVETPAVEA